MEQILQITEIHLQDEFAHQLIISGITNREHAMKSAIHWADENNCMVTEISFNEEGPHFIAVVCSDDYQ